MQSASGTSPVLIAAFQSGSRANGGLESLARIVDVLPREAIVVTDVEGEVAERMRSAGREVHVWELARINHGAPTAFDRIAGRIERAPAVPWFNARARRFMSARGVRLLLANDIRSFWHAAPGARAAGARVVFTIRDMFLAGRPYGAKWRLTQHLADAIVTLSDEMRSEALQRIQPYGGRGASVERIYSIVDGVADAPVSPEERSALGEKLGLPIEGPLFVVVGSFCDKKNQLELIQRGVGPLLRSCPDATIAFVGDFEPDRDGYAQRCLAAAKALPDPGRVRFVGFTRDVGSYYRAATATCVASRYEGLARSMIESLGAGTPVVSFDVASAREILVGHETGLVRPQGDYPGLAADLGRLAADEGLHAQLSDNGRALAHRLFAAESAAEQYERLFQRLEAR